MSISKTEDTNNSPQNFFLRSFRNPAVIFVFTFIVVVISLLTAYRYIMHTTWNDRYLFLLARHTAWVLSWIGDEVSLEGLTQTQSPEEVRAQLRAWARGVDQPTPEDFAQVSKSPLTPWEQWSFRAQRARKQNAQSKLGPRVVFTYRKSLLQQINDLEKRLQSVQEDTTLPVHEKSSQIAKLNERLIQLRARYQEIVNDPQHKKELSGQVFPFIIISECGAIEIMAIFLAGVLAYPTRWRWKIIGAILGIPLMYLVNIFRLSFLAIVGALNAGGMWFEFMHYYVWQAVYIVFVVAVWLMWIEVFVYGGLKEGGIKERLSELLKIQTLSMVFNTLWFCTKFVLIVVPLVCIWWALIPVYGWLLVQISGTILKYIMSVPILAGGIRSSGFLNTASVIYFVIQGYEFEKTSPIALLVTNVPPFIALVLATRLVSWVSKLRKILIGSGILCLGHILFIVIVLKYQEALKQYSELPVAVIQFYLTMPFMLWLGMVLRERFLSQRQENNGK